MFRYLLLIALAFLGYALHSTLHSSNILHLDGAININTALPWGRILPRYHFSRIQDTNAALDSTHVLDYNQQQQQQQPQPLGNDDGGGGRPLIRPKPKAKTSEPKSDERESESESALRLSHSNALNTSPPLKGRGEKLFGSTALYYYYDQYGMYFLSAIVGISTTTALLFSGLTNAAGSESGSSGCEKGLSKVHGSVAANITTEDGRQRSYKIHVPSNYDGHIPVPLIFSFHGRTKTAEIQEKLSQFSNEEWNPNAIAIYPQGVKNQWQGDPDSEGIDDIGFTMQLLNHLQEHYCIDPSRVYAAGKSNGGAFTTKLACDKIASTRIAAYASVSGAYYQEPTGGNDKCNASTVPIRCAPGRKHIPLLEMHGTADHTIPYTGGPRRHKCLPSVPHFVREWAKQDGLGTRNKTREFFGGNVTEFRYGTAENLGMVTHYRVEGLGHAWPSKQPNSDNSNGTYFDGTPVIMDFFERWRL